MLFFSKSKPLLKDLIPPNFVDIHSHLLFGIDDGAKTSDDTIHLVKSMIEIGVSEFITTPHTLTYVWNNTRESILEKNEDVLHLLNQNDIKVPFRSASEYIIDNEFANLFSTEKLLTLKDNYVLVEMSYLNAPIQLYGILFDLQVAGYTPILAHPERYIFYHSKPDEYKKLKKAGCLFQLNLLSTVGYYGTQVTQVADNLLKSGMIDFVGSDLHHNKHLAAFSNKVTLKDLAPLKSAMENNNLFKQEV